MATPLFRESALAHQRRNLGSELRLWQPLPHYALALLLFLMASAALTYLACGRYTRRVTVVGQLVPDQGVIQVFAPPGTSVLRRHANEGQRVQKGDVLFTLSGERVDSQGRGIESQLLAALANQVGVVEAERALSREQRSLDERRLELRADQLSAEVAGLEQLLQLRRQRVELGREAERAIAGADGVLSADEVRRRHVDVLDHALAASELELQLEVKRGELRALHAEREALPLAERGRAAAMQSSSAQLEAARITRDSEREFSILAPVTGQVTSLDAAQGRTVGQAPLCVLLPEGSALEAEVFVPTRAAGWVQPEQAVSVMYEALPYEHYGTQPARVISVSKTSTDPRQLDVPFTLGEPVYRARLRLSAQSLRAFGTDHPLHPGMLLTARVSLEERSFLALLLGPLQALAAP
jgi:membrane fusion protein